MPNKVYYQNDLTVKESFLKSAQLFYNSTPEKIDFQESTNAIETINKW